jgi:proline iminopeptidase
MTATADDHLFPPIEARLTGRLAVDPPHELYWEESGAADGLPVVFLHGGPGSGVSPKHRQFFDPAAWRIVLFDQRGAGRSTPMGELDGNTTQALVADIERLRIERGIERWVVFGGSWGSTLALAYAEAHPESCLGLIVRGIFLGAPEENAWFMQGLKLFSPAAWADFAEAAGGQGGDLLERYQRLLASDDPPVRTAAARAWGLYEARSSTLLPNPQLEAEMSGDKAVALARIEAHYFAHDCFLKPGQLLRDVEKIRHLSGVIVQGRYDLLCPLAVAHSLHEAWPEAELVVVPDAGHSAFEPSITAALVAATERMKTQVRP